METTSITILVMIFVFRLNERFIIENFALRQQLVVMKQSIKRPKMELYFLGVSLPIMERLAECTNHREA